MDYAENEFRLNQPPDSGGSETLRDHYEQLRSQGARIPEIDDAPPFPDLLTHVWQAFVELHNARPAGGMGPGPLTYETIEAYMRVTGNRLAGWEVGAVKRVDHAWLKVQGEAQKSRQAKNNK